MRRTKGQAAAARQKSRVATTSARHLPSPCPIRSRGWSDCAGSCCTSTEAAQEPEQRRAGTRAQEHDPAAQSCSLALEAVAGVPRHVPNAVQQVIEERERESDQQQPDQRMGEEDLSFLVRFL